MHIEAEDRNHFEDALREAGLLMYFTSGDLRRPLVRWAKKGYPGLPHKGLQLVKQRLDNAIQTAEDRSNEIRLQDAESKKRQGYIERLQKELVEAQRRLDFQTNKIYTRSAEVKHLSKSLEETRELLYRYTQASLGQRLAFAFFGKAPTGVNDAEN